MLKLRGISMHSGVLRIPKKKKKASNMQFCILDNFTPFYYGNCMKERKKFRKAEIKKDSSLIVPKCSVK